MANKMNFPVVLQLLGDGFVKGLASIKRQVAGFSKFMVGAFAMTGVTQFGRKMIEVSSEFEDAMARVQAVSNATAQGFKMMETEARRLGATTKFTATEAANALENLTRNGLNAVQATQALRGTLQLAQANAIGLAEAANIVTNTMNMFGLTTKDTAHINDVLSRTASTTATNITLLYEALVNAAPTAHNLDISLEEVSAALGAMAQRGVKGAEAGTQLRMALTKMVDPKIVEKLHAAGVAIDENAIRSENFVEILRRLKDANLDMAQLVEIFSQRGAHGIAQLISSYNDLRKTMWEIEDAEGTTARMFDEGLGSTKGAILMLKSAYQDFLITVGNQTRGTFNGVIKILTGFVRSLDSVGEAFLKIGALVVPLFAKKIVAAVTAAAAAIKKATFDAALFKAVIGDLSGVIMVAASWLTVFGSTLANSVNNEVKKLKKNAEDAANANITLANDTKTLISTLGTEYSQNTLNGVVKKACKLFPDMKDAIMEAALEAEKTQSYEKLIGVLNDVLRLQQAINANKGLEGLMEGYDMKMLEEIKGRAYRYVYGLFSEATPENLLKEEIKGRAKNLGKEDVNNFVDHVLGDMSKVINRSATKEEAIKAAQGIARSYGIMADDLVAKVVENAARSATRTEALLTNEQIKTNNSLINSQTTTGGTNGGGNGPGGNPPGGNKKTEREKAEEKFAGALSAYAEDIFSANKRHEQNITNEEEYQRELLRAEGTLIDAYLEAAYKLNDQTLLEKQQFKDTVKAYNERNAALKKTAEEIKTDKKDTSNDERIVKQIQDIMREAAAGPKYNKKNQNPWDAFSTDPKEFKADQIALQNLEDEMYRLQRLYDNASDKMEELGDSGVEGADEARASYKKLSEDLEKMIDQVAEKREELGKKFAENDIKELKYKNFEGYYNAVKTTTQAVNTLAETLKNLGDADWDKMNLAEKFQAITSAVFSVTDAIKSVYESFKTLNEVIGQLTEAKNTFSAISTATSQSNAAASATEAGANLMVAKTEEIKGTAAEQAAKKTAESAMVSVAANTAEAGAGAAASQASIPYVGPILAAAAAAGIIAMLAAALPKFAKGGIVQGTSKYGDRLLARVNAGEAILNQRQQKRLLDIADGRAGAIYGEVRMVAHGQDLIGVWRNINKANARISGSKGM